MSRTAPSFFELYQYATAKGITVLEIECPECKAIAIKSPTGNCYIGIDSNVIKDKSQAIKYLAHEIGHILTGALYCAGDTQKTINACELIAERQAAHIMKALTA